MVYDATYITLARELDAALITADKVLSQKAVEMDVEVSYLPHMEI